MNDLAEMRGYAWKDKSVGDIAVIAIEPVQTPLTDKRGDPICYRHLVRLLLEDGAMVYACTECDHTGERAASVRNHYAHAHGAKAPKATNSNGSGALSFLAHEYDKLTEERDRWRTRALAAERRLAAMRRALRP